MPDTADVAKSHSGTPPGTASSGAMDRHPRLRRIGEWYTLAAVTLLTCLVMVLAVEGLVRMSRKLRGDGTDPRARLSYYANTKWGAEYWGEFDRGMRYVPYTLWRRKPIAGRYVTVDSLGMRRTPGADCRPGAYTVFAFGGSTLWGTGAPDDATIPAILQREISSRMSRPVCVVNLGESAYVNTQEVIDLMLRLQGGARPDLVLFYDGINDAFVAYQWGRPGVHHNLDQFQARFGGSVATRLHTWFNSNSNAYASVSSRIARRRREEREPGTQERLARGSADAYLANHRLVDALSRQYGFDYQFFLQPVSFLAPKRLNPEEQRIVDRHARSLVATIPVFRDFMAHAEANSSDLRNFRSLTRILEGADGFVWADWAHMTPEGNRRVALEMMRTLEGRLPRPEVAPR
jgi:hypothetical protein